MPAPLLFHEIEACVDTVIEALGNRFTLALPMGLGKPVRLANAFYRRARSDPRLHLTILSGLDLEVPRFSGRLERRLMAPIAARLWPDVPDLQWALDLRTGKLPSNIEIHDFFYNPGKRRRIAYSQQNHCATNYTHVARDMFATDAPLVFCQRVAQQTIDGVRFFSDSCNADFRTDIERLKPPHLAAGKKMLHVAMIHDLLPFMYGEAVCRPECFDIVLDPGPPYGGLFAVPRKLVVPKDHLIGLYASTLFRDGGTIQVGIGSLADAVTYGLVLRHRHNEAYRRICQSVEGRFGAAGANGDPGGRAPFDQGLYACTEMLVEPFMDLYREGILKRRVYDHCAVQDLVNAGILGETVTAASVEALLERCGPVLTAADVAAFQRCNIFDPAWGFDGYRILAAGKSLSADLRDPATRGSVAAACHGRRLQNGTVAHAAFFLGSQQFYNGLHAMSEDERRLFSMTGVAVVNHLFGDQALRTAQRRDARFCNSAMMVTLLGGTVSDTLDDGTVISGVGGQYNFVSMAREMPGARAITMLRSTREAKGRVSSNIVWSCGNLTIPRHLRDIVVTEYGIADLRGKTDRQVIEALLAVSDARFQDSLAAEAKRRGKLPRNWRIPDRWRVNRPENLEPLLSPWRRQGLFPAFPFGCDLTPVELQLARALKGLGPLSWLRRTPALLRPLAEPLLQRYASHLKRMGLVPPLTFGESLLRKLVITALAANETSNREMNR